MLSVLLVCTGNICRSPMAAGFLADRSQRLLGGAIRVAGSGTWARHRNPPTPQATQAALERSVDISHLRSKRVSEDLTSRADLIVTMTAEQREEVLELDPAVAPKTFTLKELVALLAALAPPDGPPTREALLDRVARADRLRSGPEAPSIHDEDVADPLGMSAETYRAVAWEIEGLVDRLVEGLAGPAQATPGAAAGGGG